jgi:hypothetical protein
MWEGLSWVWPMGLANGSGQVGLQTRAEATSSVIHTKHKTVLFLPAPPAPFPTYHNLKVGAADDFF